MPKGYKSGRVTAGDVLNYTDIDVAKMTKEELVTAVKAVNKSVNQRVNRLRKADAGETAAVRSLMESGGMPTTKGKSRNQLIHELERGRSFLNMKTSTVRGERRVREDYNERLYGKRKAAAARDGSGDELKPLTEAQERQMWKNYNKWCEQHATEKQRLGSAQIIRAITKIMQSNPRKYRSYKSVNAEMDNRGYSYEALEARELELERMELEEIAAQSPWGDGTESIRKLSFANYFDED